MDCVYCDRPLECDACREAYSPRDPAEYQALSRPEVPIACHECGAVLVCHWCKAPYNGEGDLDEGED
jgi:hypothetical protein